MIRMTGNKYTYLAILAIVFISGMLIGVAMDNGHDEGVNNDTIYQYSTISSLMQGVFDGDMSIGDIKGYGDAGLGTFNALDGEMVVLDGTVYQIRYDGAVLVTGDDVKTPFACVTSFEKDIVMDVEGPYSMEDLELRILDALPSENLAYVIRVDGNFEHMRTRSPRPQQTPYPDLVTALEDQSIFEFEDIGGTVIGFWSPA
ncbi:MAG: acetolactate decarboxylase, partial [Candidatus Methanofastidiosa archaeon]|nr:acetolactate decarboxylase [Candidatus Methanofastidiosa archaeon]